MPANKLMMIGCLLLCAWPPGDQETKTDNSVEARNAFKKLNGALCDAFGKSLRVEQRDYQSLVEAIPPAILVLQKPPGLWTRVAMSDDSKSSDALLYSFVQDAVFSAHTLATSDADKRRWAQLAYSLTKRFLSDSRSKEVYWGTLSATGALTPDQNAVMFAISWHLQGIRMTMVRERHVKPTEWGVLAGISWSDRSDAAVLWGDQPYVDVEALKAGGLRFEVRGASVWAQNGKHGASIGIASSGARNARLGFRAANGHVYVPAKQVHSAGLFDVSIFGRGQMVIISPAIPMAGTKAFDDREKKQIPGKPGICGSRIAGRGPCMPARYH